MEIISQCPVCNSEFVEGFKAGIAPFLQDRIFKFRGPKSCKFFHCSQCDFYFFNIRPDMDEMSQLYEGYRSAVYQSQRQLYELDYTKDFNARLGKDPLEREARIGNLEKILSSNKISSSIDILDFGGNDGCMIPPSLTGNKYCFDISDVQTVGGVQSIGESELGLHHYDLIMLCHVLEHVSYPVVFLDNVTRLMGEESYLYIELPDDLGEQRAAIDFSKTIKGRIKHVVKILRPRWFMPQKPYSMGPLMHEHINCFTIPSLRELIRVSGLECVDIGKTQLNFGSSEQSILYCLARRPYRKAN